MAHSFFVILRQLVVPAGVPERHLPGRAAARLGIPESDILSCRTVRRSLDARKRRARAVHVYHLRLELPVKHRRTLRKNPALDIVFEQNEQNEKNEESTHRLHSKRADPAPSFGAARPVVVGAGPAGLFAALRLAHAGWRPILIERGDALEHRRAVVGAFWRSGVLDAESNVLFGAGGAGLFSDGKLNTRHKDRRGMDEILRLMVEAGAPESIRVDAAPHVGSDLLGDVVESILRDIADAGGEVRFRCKLKRLSVEYGALAAVTLGTGETEEIVPVRACVLATGHSARDVHGMARDAGASLEAKPFAIGLRVEMPQEQVDFSQRGGSFCPAPGEAASFRLSRAPEGGAGACYTFCMCPGGQVIACASEPEMVCVNGMSFHARAGEYANAAFLTPVAAEDFAVWADVAGPARAGVAFQEHWEKKAYRAGMPAGKYGVPASTLHDFVNGVSGALPDARSALRSCPANLRELLPAHVGETLSRSIPAMVRRLRHVDPGRVVLYGIETRTSSPVRIVRDANGEANAVRGVYPAGEGSGYAGGIMTSALDGWKAAGSVMGSR